jgi:hypothetical protein
MGREKERDGVRESQRRLEERKGVKLPRPIKRGDAKLSASHMGSAVMLRPNPPLTNPKPY